MGELFIILLVGLIIFGPEKLPELARSAGRALAKFNQAFEGVQQEIDQGMREAREAAEVKMPSIEPSESQGSERDPDDDEKQRGEQHGPRDPESS